MTFRAKGETKFIILERFIEKKYCCLYVYTKGDDIPEAKKVLVVYNQEDWKRCDRCSTRICQKYGAQSVDNHQYIYMDCIHTEL